MESADSIINYWNGSEDVEFADSKISDDKNDLIWVLKMGPNYKMWNLRFRRNMSDCGYCQFWKIF